jgi:hypothetical protein
MRWPGSVAFVLRNIQVLARGPNKVERRKASRYGLRVPVLFSWQDTQPELDGGFTRDISASGVYVLCEKNHRPAQGNTVTIQLILPSIVDLEAQGMKLRSKGQVLRTGDFPEESGFAVLAEFDAEFSTGDKSNGQSDDLP